MSFLFIQYQFGCLSCTYITFNVCISINKQVYDVSSTIGKCPVFQLTSISVTTCQKRAILLFFFSQMLHFKNACFDCCSLSSSCSITNPP
jgi:hypothetical protein